MKRYGKYIRKDRENMEEKCRLNIDKIGKIQKKSKLISEKIWKRGKKHKFNSEKIGKHRRNQS